jgi:class 3 adenylate cyclase/tetratricopeptide (TPR) repeat protein
MGRAEESRIEAVPVADGPSTATIVFTDMVGSTALRAQLGEEPADELRRVHDRLLVERIQANSGTVLKGQGDGFMAAFPAASNGLRAAVEMQQAVASYNRRYDALAQISIRIGLSVGDVSWEGGDGFGTPVIEAARLEAAADAGQILCSEFVLLMARGRGGHEFRPIGLLDLKGLPEPLAAHEVTWEPAPDQPPLPLPPELAVETARPFVSRTAELELVANVLADPTRERLAVVWLLGEPGIGKTRLATEIACRVHQAGGVALFGRCSEDISVPYQPFLEALRWHVARVSDVELADRLGGTPGELNRLAPEIGQRLPDAEAASSSSPEVEVHRLFEAVRTWLAAAGAGRPLILVVDDVQWAAGPTLALLGHLTRSAEHSRALVVCTARNTSPDDNEALAALVDELSRRGAPSHRLELAGLSIPAVGDLVELSTGRALDLQLARLAQELHRETAGNPLFLDALLAGLPADPTGRPIELPRTLAETVARRVARLPVEVTELLQTASVAGLDFDLRVAARASGHDELDALGRLEAAGRAGLVEETGPNRYRFSHGLVRSTLRDELSRSRRIRIHLQLGGALEAIYGDHLEDHADALAFHFFEAMPALGAKAYWYSVMAGERANRLLSHEEAADHYGRALEVLDQVDGPDAPARFHLLSARGEAQQAAGDLSAALATYRMAADEAIESQAPESLAHAAVAFEETSLWLGLPSGEALGLLERAAAALPTEQSTIRALTLAAMSRALRFAARQAESVERSQEALAMAERLDDPVTRVAVLARTSVPYVNVAEASTAAAQWMEVISRATEIGEDDSAIHGTSMVLWAMAQLGDLAGLERYYAEYSRLARLRRPLWDQILISFRSFRAFIAADLEAAEQFLAHAEEVGEARGWIREGLYGVAMFLLRREQGRLAEIAPAIRAVARLNLEDALWRPGLAALYVELGMLDEARAEFEGFAGAELENVPHDASRELCLGLLAEVCAALGDAARALRLIEELLPCEGRLLVFLGSAVCLGPTDRLLGMLASTAGRSDDAERWHRSALEMTRRLDSPLWRAHCLYDRAAHLLSTDAVIAGEMLAEAAAVCERHGLAGLAVRVERLRAAS